MYHLLTLHEHSFSRDRPRFADTLDMIKFLCKDVWTLVFRKQIDNLKTNHRVLPPLFFPLPPFPFPFFPLTSFLLLLHFPLPLPSPLPFFPFVCQTPFPLPIS